MRVKNRNEGRIAEKTQRNKSVNNKEEEAGQQHRTERGRRKGRGRVVDLDGKNY